MYLQKPSGKNAAKTAENCCAEPFSPVLFPGMFTKSIDPILSPGGYAR
jgi:hypothetical protein